jgi:hypothetical protein
MATANCSGGAPPASARSASVRPRPLIRRGQLFHALGPAAFGTLTDAICAWSAARAEQDDIATPDVRSSRGEGGAP